MWRRRCFMCQNYHPSKQLSNDIEVCSSQAWTKLLSTDFAVLVIFKAKTKTQALGWLSGSSYLYWHFFLPITLSCLFFVPQHLSASKMSWLPFTELPQLQVSVRHALAAAELSEEAQAVRRNPQALWSPLLLEAVRLKQDVCLVSGHASSSDQCLVSKAYPETVMRWSGLKAKEESACSNEEINGQKNERGDFDRSEERRERHKKASTPMLNALLTPHGFYSG